MSVEERVGGSAGVLESTDSQGVTSRREVAGDDCAEVVSALALIAALSVDSQARTDPAVVAPATDAEAPANSGASPSAAPGPLSSAPAPPPHVEVLARVPAETPRAAAGSELDSASNFRWSIGVHAQALGGLAPTWPLGGGAFLALEHSGAGIFSPSFRLAPWIAMTSVKFAGNVGADITWYAGRLEVCPLRPGLAPAFRLEACFGVDAGAMRSTGFGVDHPDTDHKFWLAALALGRLGWSVSEAVRAELGLGLVVPVTRDPFVVDAGSGQAHEVSRIHPLGALFTLGAAYEFQ